MKRLIIFMTAPKKITLKTFLPGAFILFFLFPFAARAATYSVQPGDTLYGISLRHGVSVQALQEANGITGHLIYPGQKLTIPDANPDTCRNKASEEVLQRLENSRENPKQPQVSYTVQAGDCLYAIAGRYGISVEALKQANNLSSELIYPGQALVIPAPTIPAPSIPAPQAAKPDASKIRPGAGDLPSRSGAASPQLAKKVLGLAASLLGSRYVYGGSGPHVFDCSGFVAYVFRSVGIELPHSAAAQAKFGTPVERSSLLPGDLVFFSYYGSGGIDHVGIYVGNDDFIHASSKGGVKYSSLNQPYYRQNYRGARRLIAG